MPRYLRNLIIALVVIAVLIGLDFVFQGRMLNPYFVRILMLSGIAITLAVSLNLINGFTGHTYLASWPGTPPRGVGGTWTDPLTGVTAALASLVAAALVGRSVWSTAA